MVVPLEQMVQNAPEQRNLPSTFSILLLRIEPKRSFDDHVTQYGGKTVETKETLEIVRSSRDPQPGGGGRSTGGGGGGGESRVAPSRCGAHYSPRSTTAATITAVVVGWECDEVERVVALVVGHGAAGGRDHDGTPPIDRMGLQMTKNNLSRP